MTEYRGERSGALLALMRLRERMSAIERKGRL